MEKVRQILIAWNVAPLIIAGIFCILLWRLVDALIVGSCEMDVAKATVLAGLATGLAALVHKIYNSLQRDRRPTDEDSA